MYLEILENIVSEWNAVLRNLNNEDYFLVVKKDHKSFLMDNAYYISIIRNDDILFRKGFNFKNDIPNDPFNEVAKMLLPEIAFMGFSRILEMYKEGKLFMPKYLEK